MSLQGFLSKSLNRMSRMVDSSPDMKDIYPYRNYSSGKKNVVDLIFGDSNKSAFEKSLEKKRTKHKAQYPYLFDKNKQGSRWDFDPLLLREQAQNDPFIGMVIQLITREISNIPWQIVDDDNSETRKSNPFERKSKDEKEDVATQRAKKLLSNPHPDYDFSDLIMVIMSDYLEVGSYCLIKNFSQRYYEEDRLDSEDPMLESLSPVDPLTMTKGFSKKGIVEFYYQFSPSSEKRSNRGTEPIKFDKKEVVWSDINKRTNRRYGLPPTLMVFDILQLLSLTIEQEQKYFSRGMISPGALVFEDLDNKEVDALMEEIESNNRGSPEKMLMLGAGGSNVDFEPFSFNFKELQYMEREEWYAKIISSAFQVPPSIVGIKPENVNRATYRGEREHYETSALASFLQDIERTFTDQIIKPHIDNNKRFEFVPGTSESKRKEISERLSREFNDNIISVNEYREKLGYNKLDDERGDKFKEDLDTDSGQNLQDLMSSKKKDNKSIDEALRNSDDWHLFSYQPDDVENLKSKISDKFKQLWQSAIQSDKLEDVIEQYMTDPDHPPANKSIGSVLNILQTIMSGKQVADEIADIIQDKNEEIAEGEVNNLIEQEDLDVDTDPIISRVKDRKLNLADDITQRLESDIKDTIAEGWEKGQSVNKIKNNLMDKSDEWTDYQAERLARDQLQRATGEARNEFARQTNMVEVWLSSGDHRVREAHKEMDGKWKRPSEAWEVEYDEGTVYEDFPGDSKYGIQCRCTTKLVDKDQVDSKDHKGELR